MKKYLLLIIILVISGCSTNLGTLSLISTLEKKDNIEYESVGYIKGKDTQYIILGIPTGRPRIDLAINNALLDNDAVYMTNTSISYDQFYFLIYFGFMTIKVSGEGWAEVDKTNIYQSSKKLLSETLKKETEKNIESEPIVLEKRSTSKTEKIIKYDPNTGLPMKPKKYDSETGKPIYE